MLTEPQLAECRSRVIQLAPELQPAPLYVVDAELLHDLPCNTGCILGWADASGYVDLNVVDRLSDQYTGPGNLIVIDGEAIAAYAQPGQFERCVFNVALHEAAHILPARTVTLDLPNTPTVREIQLARMATAFSGPVREPGTRNDPHDWRFIRRACHLYYRARMAEFDVTPHRLFGPYEWLAYTEIYLDTLLPELVKLSGATFSEIERAPTTRDFTLQWEADLKFYNDIFVRGN